MFKPTKKQTTNVYGSSYLRFHAAVLASSHPQSKKCNRPVMWLSHTAQSPNGKTIATLGRGCVHDSKYGMGTPQVIPKKERIFPIVSTQTACSPPAPSSCVLAARIQCSLTPFSPYTAN